MTDIVFNEEQLGLINLILNTNENVHIQGQAGTGKTAILVEIINRSIKNGKRVAITATTGIASINLPGGQTLHSFLNVGLKGTKRLTIENRDTIKTTDILIIDEVSMLPDYYFSNIYKHIKGLQLIFCGDLYQLPPVCGRYFFTTPEYKLAQFKIISLTCIFRQLNETYKKVLCMLRKAKCSDKALQYLGKFDISKKIDVVNDNTIKLFSTNNKVNAINKTKMNELDTPEYVSIATDYRGWTGNFSKINDKNVSFILDALVQREFVCKIGAKVMVTRNHDGLVNGHRGVIIDINEEIEQIKVDFYDRGIIWISKLNFDSPLDGKVVRRSQYPLKLAWAITIHKSQGMTLENVLVDVSNCFASGMLYVAMSRIKDPDQMAIVNLHQLKFGLIPNKVVKKFLRSDVLSA